MLMTVPGTMLANKHSVSKRRWEARTHGIQPVSPARRVDLPNGRSLIFNREAIFGGVTIRSHADVQLGAIGTRDKALRPMVVNGAARQLGHLCRGPFELGVARSVS